MAKKSLPVSVQLFILVAVAALLMGGGYFMMRKTLPLADVVVNERGVVIMNRNVKDWPGGKLFINEPGQGIEAILPPIATDEERVIPYSAFYEFFQNRSYDKLEIEKIWISDMAGYADRGFDVPNIIIHSEIRPEQKQ